MGIANCIYVISNRESYKGYVGQATDLERRIASHKYLLSVGRHSNPHLQAAYNKYGWQAFEVLVIERDLEVDELDSREMFWIWHTKANDPELGYNIVENPSRSPMLGRAHTEAAKKAMSEAHKLLLSESPKERVRLLRLAKLQNLDAERQTKMALLRSKRPAGFCLRNKKKYIVTAPDGTEYVANSLSKFCRERGLPTANLRNLALGKTSSSRVGWKCRYLREG